MEQTNPLSATQLPPLGGPRLCALISRQVCLFVVPATISHVTYVPQPRWRFEADGPGSATHRRGPRGRAESRRTVSAICAGWPMRQTLAQIILPREHDKRKQFLVSSSGVAYGFARVGNAGGFTEDPWSLAH